MKLQLRFLAVMFCLFGFLGSCNNEEDSPVQKKHLRDLQSKIDALLMEKTEVFPKIHSGTYFSVGENQQIAIKKAALGERFMVAPTITDYELDLPSNVVLAAKVVIFRREGKSIYMQQPSDGKVLSDDFQYERIITAFPILAETEEELIIDFHKGIQDMPITGDTMTNVDAGSYFLSPGDISMIKGYVEEATIRDDQLWVKQVVQLQSFLFRVPAIEVKFKIYKYEPNPDFKPFQIADDDAHFIPGTDVLETSGEYKRYSVRFADNEPIVYALSSNIPEEYQEAVKDGVLYWNKVFGEDRIEVLQLTEEDDFPDFHKNYIQWVNNPHLSYAYAAIQADPLTGETLSSYILIPDWVEDTVHQMQRISRLTQVEPAAEGARSLALSLGAFKSARVCQHPRHGAKVSHERLLDEPPSEDKILEVGLDSIREVVAHEVGHTLGLLHNFAGSLSAKNYPLSERSQTFADYVDDGKSHDDIEFSSSVMDYHTLVESSLVGNQIEKEDSARKYDEVAIKWLYDGEDPKDLPLHCNDDTMFNFDDCNTFDYGASITNYYHHRFQLNYLNIPLLVFEKFVHAKAPAINEEALDIRKISMDSGQIVSDVVGFRDSLLYLQESGVYLLKTLQEEFPGYTLPDAGLGFDFFDFMFSFGGFSEPDLLTVDAALYEAEVRKLIDEQVKELGGLKQLFPVLTIETKDQWVAQFKEIVDNPKFYKGLGYNGQEYEFSGAERKWMKNQAESIFSEAFFNLASDAFDLWGYFSMATTDVEQMTTFVEILDAHKKEYLLKLIADRTYDIELPAIASSSDKITLSLPVFAYPVGLRSSALYEEFSYHGSDLQWPNIVLGNLEEETYERYGDQSDIIYDEAFEGTGYTFLSLGEFLESEILDYKDHYEWYEVESMVYGGGFGGFFFGDLFGGDDEFEDLFDIETGVEFDDSARVLH